MQLVDSADKGTFTKPELERLAAYRAAVAAGFYTDWDGSAASADTEVLAWLGATDGLAATAGDPFTADERQRPERGRAAGAGGAARKGGGGWGGPRGWLRPGGIHSPPTSGSDSSACAPRWRVARTTTIGHRWTRMQHRRRRAR